MRALVLAILVVALLRASDRDHDRDGLDDRLEQEILERFAPRFELSANECGGLPAEFVPGKREPVIRQENGAVYGQVTPRAGGRRLEVHYYHLWSRDCGKLAHALDAEHVSALLETAGGDRRKAKSWHARYWYAAAHEDTLCDASRGIRADLLEEGSTRRGARVWISRGKHASHLSLESCSRGCGGDRCEAPFTTLRPERIINLGEIGFPADGAAWIRSEKWPLAAKFDSDFPEPFLRELDGAKGLVAAQPMLNPAQTALGSTGGALDTGYRRTRKSLEKARQTVGDWFRRGR